MPIIIDETMTIPSGTHHMHARSVPSGVSSIEVTATRENWPAGGVTVRLQMTFDATTNFQTVAEATIGPGTANPKDPGVIPPAKFSFGWGHDPQPVRARLEATSPSSFSSHVTVEAFRDIAALKAP